MNDEIEYYDFVNYHQTRHLNQMFVPGDIAVKKVVIYNPKLVSSYKYKIDKLGPDVKSVRFVLRTRFNRQTFRQMYPNLQVKYTKADCLIYDQDALIGSKHHSIYKLGEHYISYNIWRALTDLTRYYNPPPNTFKNTALGTYGEDVKSGKIKIYDCKTFDVGNDYYLDMRPFLADQTPIITVKDVFQSAESEFRNESLSLEDIISIYDQITNRNEDIHKIGIDLLSMINPEKYFPIMFFFYALHTKFNTAKGSILYKFVNEKLREFKVSTYYSSNATPQIAVVDMVLGLMRENKIPGEIDVHLVKEFFKHIIYKHMAPLGSNIKISSMTVDLI